MYIILKNFNIVKKANKIINGLLVNKSKGLFLNFSRDSASFDIVYDPFLMLISSLPRFFSASNPLFRHSSNFLRPFLCLYCLC